MVGDIFSLVVSGAIVLSGLIFMAAVIIGSRSEANVRERDDRGRYYRDIPDGANGRMSVARARSSPGLGGYPAISRKVEPRHTRPAV